MDAYLRDLELAKKKQMLVEAEHRREEQKRQIREENEIRKEEVKRMRQI